MLPGSFIHGQWSWQGSIQVRSFTDGATCGQRFSDVSDQCSTSYASHNFSPHPVWASFSERNTVTNVSFHRTILYPRLEDNEIVKSYPDVKGMSENVVFFTHNHKEDGGGESVSKVNSFEVRICNAGNRKRSTLAPPGKNDRRPGHVLPASGGIQRSR